MAKRRRLLLDNYPEILTVADFQEYLNLGKSQAYEIVNREHFPKIKIKKKIIIYKENFKEWLSSNGNFIK